MKKLSLSVIVVVFFVIIGCGYAPKGKGPIFSSSEITPEKAKVIHYRVPSIVGNGAYYKLYMNDEFVTGIGNGGYYDQDLSPGDYEFSTLSEIRAYIGIIDNAISNMMAEKEHQLSLKVEPNKVYYLRWNATESYCVEEVDEVKAIEELRDLQKFELAEED
jgi:Protein of unknown function (DUF2846)